MEERTLRTIGASVVLFGVALAGIVQMANAEPAPPPEIALAPTSAERAALDGSGRKASVTAEPAFVYRVGVLAGIDTSNFWRYYGESPSVWNSYVLGPTKPALYAVDPDSGGLVPELIANDVTPTWNSDGWRVRFDLNENFAWSDGIPITARDLVFTFRTVRDLGLLGSWAHAFPDEVASVHADGEFKVRIEFSSRPDLSVWPFGVGQAPIMARHVWEPIVADVTAESLYAVDGGNDVSGGPLTLTEVSDSLIISEANPGYPGEQTPDKVEYHVYESEAALVEAVARGNIDTLLNPKGLAPEHVESLADDPKIAVETSPANGVRYLGFNLTREPMSDPAFRSAVALLVDRDGMASAIPQSGPAAWSLLPEANGQWYDSTVVEGLRERYSGTYTERFAAALTGLKAAAYTWATEPSLDGDGELIAGQGLLIDGVPPQTLTILTPGDAYEPARPDYVRRIADILVAIGFDARPVETDFDTVVELAFTPDESGDYVYDMYFLGWTLGNPALPGFYGQFFAGELNNTGYSSEAFDAARSRYESAHSKLEAKAALWDMERIIASDLPYLPLYSSELTEVYRSDAVEFEVSGSLGGLQGRLGGIGDVRPVD